MGTGKGKQHTQRHTDMMNEQGKEKRKQRVVHVELLTPYNGKHNYYFGSVAAIYDTLPTEIVGIGQDALYNLFSKTRTYRGRLSIIRDRRLLRKNTQRGQRKRKGE